MAKVPFVPDRHSTDVALVVVKLKLSVVAATVTLAGHVPEMVGNKAGVILLLVPVAVPVALTVVSNWEMVDVSAVAVVPSSIAILKVEVPGGKVFIAND